MKNRREFLKTTCPTVAFAFFGVSLIQACSSSEDPMPTVPTNNGQTNTDTAGVTQNGNTITIDLNASNFSGLASVGSWMNLTSAGVLLLRVSTDTIRAFDNCCPHQGTRTQWSYGNNTFNCAKAPLSTWNKTLRGIMGGLSTTTSFANTISDLRDL